MLIATSISMSALIHTATLNLGSPVRCSLTVIYPFPLRHAQWTILLHCPVLKTYSKWHTLASEAKSHTAKVQRP
ncbi:hypothetical protein BD309DRAFT_969983 [Dichomitus squalens]|nr:hypothetical protein BD309DRAFT_969983 [Dichomitus squalens]